MSNWVTTVYEKVGGKRTKKGKCPVCGKQAIRTKEFYQTINPWNKNKDGNLKTYSEIWSEESIKMCEWEQKAVVHAKCQLLYNEMEERKNEN